MQCCLSRENDKIVKSLFDFDFLDEILLLSLLIDIKILYEDQLIRALADMRSQQV